MDGYVQKFCMAASRSARKKNAMPTTTKTNDRRWAADRRDHRIRGACIARRTAARAPMTRLTASSASIIERARTSSMASYAAYLAMEDVRALSMIEALLAVSLVIGALAAVLLAMHAPRIRWSRRSAAHLRSFVFVVVGIAFFFLARREAAMQNFWTYPSIGIGVLAAGVSRSLRQHLDRVYPSRAPLAAAVFLLVANSLAIHTTAAFPLAIVATLVALDSILCREPLPPSQLVVAFCIGSAIGFASPFSLPVMTALAMLLVAAPSTMAARLPPEPTPERRPGRGFAGLLLVLPLGALAIPSSYVLSLQLDMQGAALTTVATFLLILSGLAVWCLDRLLPIRDATRSAMAALGLAVVSCGAVLVTRGALAASLALLAF